MSGLECTYFLIQILYIIALVKVVETLQRYVLVQLYCVRISEDCLERFLFFFFLTLINHRKAELESRRKQEEEMMRRQEEEDRKAAEQLQVSGCGV